VNRLFIVSILGIAIIVLALGALVFVTQQQPSHAPTVDLDCGNGTILRISVEVADTPGEQKHGLMNRTSLPRDAGMLFVFNNDDSRYFWMDNTLIPLDMIFIASNLTIIDIHENAMPLSRDIIASSGPCRYVLEINGGLCAANGINVGDRVAMDLD
jgi:uncharacterized membrane protein (UPF0127 family)